jgi:hypothetical protein
LQLYAYLYQATIPYLYQATIRNSLLCSPPPTQTVLEENESNKQQRTASPAPSPPLPIHTLTVNIDGLDSGKWEQITKMPVFPQLDIIILTEHHLSAKFRPTYIVESGWDILMAEPPKQGHLRHIDRGGVAILWKSSANWEVKQEIVSDHTSHQSAHQCDTWTIKSKQFSHPIHITGVYITPTGTGTEDFYHTLEQQNKFPPLHTHVFTGDFNAHVAEEQEEALLALPTGIVPPRKGDVARNDTSRLRHPPLLPT